MIAGIIRVTGVKCYSHHGCLPEETKIGQWYTVDVVLHCDFMEAAESDALVDTIDYVDVNRIVEQEMAIPAKLIEHVGLRIVKRLKKEFAQLEKAEVTVIKPNPPINGHVQDVSITIEG